MESSLLQSVLPVELPEDLLRHLAGYLDIDTRRALRIPPGRLTADRYAPLANLTIPVSYHLQWVVVCLGYVSPIVSLKERAYRYKRVRAFYTDGSFAEERVMDKKTGDSSYWSYMVVSSTVGPSLPSTGIDMDFYKLSEAQSWYKRVPLNGADFAMYLDPDARWQFSLWEYRPADTVSHRVRLGPFMKGVSGIYGLGVAIVYGFHAIVMKASEDAFREWIDHHYPHYSHIDWGEEGWMAYDNASVALEEIYMNEYTKYWCEVKNIAAKYKP